MFLLVLLGRRRAQDSWLPTNTAAFMPTSAALILAGITIIGQIVTAIFSAVTLCPLTLPRWPGVRHCRRFLCQRLGEHWLKMNAGAVVVALVRPTAEDLVVGRGTLLPTIVIVGPVLPSSSLIVTEVLLAIFLTGSTRRVLLRWVKSNITDFEFFNVHLLATVFITLVRWLVRLLFLKLVFLATGAKLVVLKHVRVKLNRAVVQRIGNALVDHLLLDAFAGSLGPIKHPEVAIRLRLLLKEFLLMYHVGKVVVHIVTSHSRTVSLVSDLFSVSQPLQYHWAVCVIY